MGLFEVMQLFSMSGAKLDALWQFFVSVHLALFGGLYVFHKMKDHQIAITVVSYTVFSLINIRAKIQEYGFYESLLKEVRESSSLHHVGYLTSFFEQYDVSDRVLVTIFVHVLSFLFLVYLLWRARVRHDV